MITTLIFYIKKKKKTEKKYEVMDYFADISRKEQFLKYNLTNIILYVV